MRATRECFPFLGIGRVAIVPVEKLETKRNPAGVGGRRANAGGFTKLRSTPGDPVLCR